MSINELEQIKNIVDSITSDTIIVSQILDNLINKKIKNKESQCESNDEAKEVLNKKVRKPRTKKEGKKAITIVDDSNDDPLTVEV